MYSRYSKYSQEKLNDILKEFNPDVIKRYEGLSKRKAFLYGVLSGVVEPISACITIFLVNIFVPILPYILAFAAGSTMYIVVVELLPKSQTGESSQIGILGFTIGFVAMMILDIAIV